MPSATNYVRITDMRSIYRMDNITGLRRLQRMRRNVANLISTQSWRESLTHILSLFLPIYLFLKVVIQLKRDDVQLLGSICEFQGILE